MKRILFIANYKENAGGISTQVDILNRLLSREGYETSIFSLKGGIWFRIKAFFKLLKVGNDYDVFHIHACSDWGFLPVIMGVFVGRKMRKRIVVTYHGGGAETFFNKHKRLVKRWLRKTDSNIVLSGFLKEVFDRNGIPCVVIPNIVERDVEMFKERTSIYPRFISIRSLTPTYNIRCTLDAFQIVKRSYPESTLLLLGDGSLRYDLEWYVKEHQIDGVTFVGRVINKMIYDYMNKADIMLSSPNADNMPMSLLEGFNAGLLVISSNVGGVPYMIEHRRTGLLFASSNSEEMAEQMLWALSHQAESLQIIRNAKDEIEKYSWEANRMKYEIIYNSESR